MESTGETITMEWRNPLELFEERDIVRMCAPMVRYSKLVHTEHFKVTHSNEC